LFTLSSTTEDFLSLSLVLVQISDWLHQTNIITCKFYSN